MRKSYLIAAVIAAVPIAWVAYGEATREAGPPAATAPLAAAPAGEAPHSSVRVRRLEAEPYRRSLLVTGRTEAKRKVDLMAELDGRVAEIAIEKGRRVKKGELIARLALDDRSAWLTEAKATLRQREIEHRAASELAKKGYRAETSAAGAAAALDAARAQVRRMEVEIDKTAIRAPFDAVVDARPAELGAYLKAGQKVATLVDEDPYLVVAHLSENDIGQIRLGGTARADLATGIAVEGRISFIASTADPATRTFRVEVEVPNPDRLLRDGITATVGFAVAEVLAHRVSPAVLTLDEGGRIGVRAVAGDGTVAFHEARIVAEAGGGVWLAGLPERLDLIVVGQEFVRSGDKVTTVPADDVAATADGRRS